METGTRPLLEQAAACAYVNALAIVGIVEMLDSAGVLMKEDLRELLKKGERPFAESPSAIASAVSRHLDFFLELLREDGPSPADPEANHAKASRRLQSHLRLVMSGPDEPDDDGSTSPAPK